MPAASSTKLARCCSWISVKITVSTFHVAPIQILANDLAARSSLREAATVSPH